MTVYSEIKTGQKPYAEIIEQIREASHHEISFDEDSPEYDYDDLVRMRLLAQQRQNEKQITLSLPDSTVEKAKSFDKNYRTFLSRLLRLAVDDPDMIQRAMI